MLGSPVLGAAVGLVLLFATTSLLCAVITESLSNLFQMRARYLLTGLRSMLDDPETYAGAGKDVDKQLHQAVKDPQRTKTAADELQQTAAAGQVATADVGVVTTALFNSPLLTSLQSRRVRPFGKGSVRNPQYVSAQAFVRALVDLLVPSDPDGAVPVTVDVDALAAGVQKLPSPTLRRQLTAFLSAAGQDVSTFERSLENWYDEEMAKISGWYKRWARVALGITGFIVAVLFNLDSLQVGHSLYVDAPIQQAVIATADTGALCQNVPDRVTCVSDELATLKADALPIGWPDTAAFGSVWDGLLKIVGWGLTAFAVSFGAPFWFEALSKLGSLRNTGTRPADRTG
jgi:hypothetical protein